MILLDLFMALFPFHENVIINLLLTTGIVCVTFKISWIIVGCLAPFLDFDSKRMSELHWVLRIMGTFVMTYFIAKCNMFVTCSLAIIGLAIILSKCNLIKDN